VPAEPAPGSPATPEPAPSPREKPRRDSVDEALSLELINGEFKQLKFLKAATAGHADKLAEMMSEKECREATTKQGHTALHLAAYNQHLECVQALLLAGLDPNARTDFGLTALDYADKATAYPIIELLTRCVEVDPEPAQVGCCGLKSKSKRRTAKVGACPPGEMDDVKEGAALRALEAARGRRRSVGSLMRAFDDDKQELRDASPGAQRSARVDDGEESSLSGGGGARAAPRGSAASADENVDALGGADGAFKKKKKNRLHG